MTNDPLLRFAALSFATLLAAAAPAQQDGSKTPPQRLTLDRIYRDGDFRTRGYAAKWLADGRYARLEKAAGPHGGQDLAAYEPASGKREVLVPAERLTPTGSATPLTVSGYAFSRDYSKLLVYTNTKRVWRQNSRGDYWLLDRTSHELKKLGGDAAPSTLMFAKLSPDGLQVAYVRDRNLYVEPAVGGGPPRRLTEGGEQVINGTFDWVYEEELGLRDGFAWSPDSRRIAYWQLDVSGVRQFPLVNNTAGLYPTIQWIAYPKTGQRNSASRVGVLDVGSGETSWLPIPGDPRQNYLARMEWAPHSQQLVVQQLNRLQNRNTVYHYDAETGRLSELLTESDEAWVEIQSRLQWSGRRFAWLSERSGRRQLYLQAAGGGPLTPVTERHFAADVISLEGLSDSHAYFTASPDNATQRYLFRVELKQDARPRRATPEGRDGWHQYDISPGCQWAIHTFSRFDAPPVTELVRLADHHVARTLEENKSARESLKKLGPRRPHTELLQVEIEPGLKLDGWCIRPAQIDRQKKHPLLIYVYGEPAGTTVRDRWGGSTQMWHRMLAQQGCVVVSFDNRGTPAPKGRQWRKCVYRQVGVLAPKDQAAAVRQVLEQRPYLDPQRVGVWGWSGGGSMTLNAMFKFPELYHVGISIAPVPNQRLYDTIYQERYMGLPRDNVRGYHDGSPLNFAKQLQGELLLIHGTGDDNCHYQGMEALINELVRHNKPFAMMAYPNRSHGIHEGANTSRHLRELMTRFLQDKLLQQ